MLPLSHVKVFITNSFNMGSFTSSIRNMTRNNDTHRVRQFYEQSLELKLELELDKQHGTRTRTRSSPANSLELDLQLEIHKLTSWNYN